LANQQQQCNFSLTHYIDTLLKYKEAGYIFGKDILLRHDVDLSLEYALELAKQEYKHDIKATYYIMLHSSLYNAQSPEGMKIIREIHRLGGKIGLHIDTRYHLENDFDTLSLILGEPVRDWRRHLVNITPEFKTPEPRPEGYKYISDSAMNWREGCFCQHIGKHDKMEILIHAEWWTVSPAGKRNKFEIMEDIAQEARGTLGNSFHNFRDLVMEYEQTQTLNIHTKSSQHSEV